MAGNEEINGTKSKWDKQKTQQDVRFKPNLINNYINYT